MIDKRFKCVAVQSPRGARTTRIKWADGHEGLYPHAILRGYCPCAGCQGHSGIIKFQETGDFQQEIDTIEPVGNYALQFKWFDGHDSGLYSYRYLRALCFCEQCRPGDAQNARDEMPRL
jgi:DUF971 family protein